MNAYVAGWIWAILWVIVIVALFSGCSSTLSPHHAKEIGAKVTESARIASLPVASISFTSDGTFGGTYAEDVAAEADCSSWNITFNYQFAASRPRFVIDKVVPHEYAHLAACWTRGRGSKHRPPVDHHDEIWRQWVIRLNGDPDYV